MALKLSMVRYAKRDGQFSCLPMRPCRCASSA